MASPRLKQSAVVDVTCGERVLIIEPANVYGCTLGNDVFIGPFVEVQRGVTVGARTRIQSHAFVCELVSIGEDCFISHGAMFVKDLFRIGGPARGDQSLWSRCSIGDRVSIGTHATVLPVAICDDVVIGAGAVVTKDISEPGIYAGNPAQKLRTLKT